MAAAAFYTLGCKLNQAESEEFAAAFIARGFDVASGAARESAEIAVVNTCTVTSKADQKARRLIRSLLESPSRPIILVTGCYARLNKSQIEALDHNPPEARRLFVVDNVGGSPPLAPQSSRGCAPVCSATPPAGEAPATPPFVPALRSRAFIKIQDGCDNACSYCRVRLARGAARSQSSKAILEQVLALEEFGAAEAVLTGVNISQYRDGNYNLAGLLRFLLDGTNQIALRLASLEPAVCTEDFFNAVKDRRIRPHFHLSVQSANGAVLKAMRRDYTAGFLLEIIRRLREIRYDILGDPFIACDIIAGFPGEGDAEFEETFDFCVKADFAWIHAFPFSPRPGTEAASRGFSRRRVPERTAGERVERLIALAKEGHRRYYKRWEGREVEAIVEERRGESGGVIVTTENYLKIELDFRGADAGKKCVVKVPPSAY